MRHSIGGLLQLGLWIREKQGPREVVLDVNRSFALKDGRPEDRAIMFAFLNEQDSVYLMDHKGTARTWEIPKDLNHEMALDQVVSESLALNR